MCESREEEQSFSSSFPSWKPAWVQFKSFLLKTLLFFCPICWFAPSSLLSPVGCVYFLDRHIHEESSCPPSLFPCFLAGSCSFLSAVSWADASNCRKSSQHSSTQNHRTVLRETNRSTSAVTGRTGSSDVGLMFTMNVPGPTAWIWWFLSVWSFSVAPSSGQPLHLWLDWSFFIF